MVEQIDWWKLDSERVDQAGHDWVETMRPPPTFNIVNTYSTLARFHFKTPLHHSQILISCQVTMAVAESYPNRKHLNLTFFKLTDTRTLRRTLTIPTNFATNSCMRARPHGAHASPHPACRNTIHRCLRNLSAVDGCGDDLMRFL